MWSKTAALFTACIWTGCISASSTAAGDNSSDETFEVATTVTDPGTRVGDRVGLQGNLDPAVLLSAPEVIRREAGKILAGYGYGNGHVFNLGHGVSQFTPPEHVAALVETVHSGSPQFH